MKKYKIKYQEASGIKEINIETSDLSNENLPTNIISIREDKKIDSFLDFFKDERIKDKEIQLLFYELSLMLESRITLGDSLDILIKNKKNKQIINLLELIKSSLSSSHTIASSIKKFKINYLVGAFFDMSKDNGNIELNIKALNNLLTQSLEIKKKFIKSISYPIVLLSSFFLALFAMFYFVIPKFKVIFEQTSAPLPLATKILLNVQSIFENYFLFILIFFALIFFLFFYIYSKNEDFKYFLHKLIAKDLHVISDIYLNMQLYRIFLILNIMLESGYEFHKALISSKVLLKNKYLLDKINTIDNLLKNGKDISSSFQNSELFDDIVLNLINTGEVSNSLDITVNEIKSIYKNRFDDKISLLTSMIEPIFLLCIMSLILWIVLAVFMPMWDMGNLIKF